MLCVDILLRFSLLVLLVWDRRVRLSSTPSCPALLPGQQDWAETVFPGFLQPGCGAHGDLRPCSSRSAPQAHVLHGEGDPRGYIVTAGSLWQEEVSAFFPSVASSSPRGARTFSCLHVPSPWMVAPGHFQGEFIMLLLSWAHSLQPSWGTGFALHHNAMSKEMLPTQLTPLCPQKQRPLAPAFSSTGK